MRRVQVARLNPNWVLARTQILKTGGNAGVVPEAQIKSSHGHGCVPQVRKQVCQLMSFLQPIWMGRAKLTFLCPTNLTFHRFLPTSLRRCPCFMEAFSCFGTNYKVVLNGLGQLLVFVRALNSNFLDRTINFPASDYFRELSLQTRELFKTGANWSDCFDLWGSPGP
jgi:hypothetical protein